MYLYRWIWKQDRSDLEYIYTVLVPVVVPSTWSVVFYAFFPISYFFAFFFFFSFLSRLITKQYRLKVAMMTYLLDKKWHEVTTNASGTTTEKVKRSFGHVIQFNQRPRLSNAYISTMAPPWCRSLLACRILSARLEKKKKAGWAKKQQDFWQWFGTRKICGGEVSWGVESVMGELQEPGGMWFRRVLFVLFVCRSIHPCTSTCTVIFLFFWGIFLFLFFR